MSDPEVPKNEQHHDVDDVVGRANEGLDAAAAARDDVPRADDTAQPVDPDMEAFVAAERDYPGTFQAPDGAADAHRETTRDGDPEHDPAPHEVAADGHPAQESRAQESPAGEQAVGEHSAAESVADGSGFGSTAREAAAADAVRRNAAQDDTERYNDASRDDDRTAILYAAPTASETSDRTRVLDADQQHATTVADSAYAASARPSAETQVVPAEPVAPPAAPQPIFVQAPEPPRELGNRGAAGAIGLVAAVAFALLYLAAILGFGALRGEVTVESIGTAALEPLTMWSFWVPVAVFFLAFWLLGAFLNRARWGLWVILGLLVAAATYGGYLLGQLFQAPFWRITGTESVELVNEQLLAPLAIACFIFARELTIWFGAWVARSGRRKTELNAEAQAEYERTLEAGPAALR